MFKIKNRTIYNGKIRLKFEKYPEYSGAGNFLNIIHLNLGFTKLVSRITCDMDEVYNVPFLNKIANCTNLKLVTSYYKNYDGTPIKTVDGVATQLSLTIDDAELNIKLPSITPDISTLVHFTNENNDYIGLDFGYWAYKYNMKATQHPQVFEYYNDNKLIGYCGYSHRASATFKLGDKLFEENWQPEDKLEKTKETTPFIKHGYKDIETFEEAFQAALNFAHYVS
jgi:hypothetical protein